MSQAAQLAGRIVVCHREPGFLRLELPVELCTADIAADLGAGVRTLAGVVSAAVDTGWQRISIRYDAAQLTTAQVARQLFDVVDALPLDTAAALWEAHGVALLGFVPETVAALSELLDDADPRAASAALRLRVAIERALGEPLDAYLE